ncbi:MAG: NAD-dependent epimerase/dehydratase family protein [Frankiaceae bacterium]
MRVVVLGGTRFIGRAVVEELAAVGDEVAVVHRGDTEPADLPAVVHVHSERSRFADVADEVRRFGAEAIVDCTAYTGVDVDSVLPYVDGQARLVLLSSMDVYRAFGAVLTDTETDPLPITEESPVRPERYPYRDSPRYRLPDYDKLDVEPRYLERGAAVLRLPMVYGPRDPQRREEFMLRRVRAGRRRIPIGAGNWLWTRGFIGDVAHAIALAARTGAATGEVLNVGEPTTGSFGMWARQILTAAEHDAELVPVPDRSLPDDLRFLAARAQHVLVDSSKATRLLGWRHSPIEDAVRASVRWHLAHPPVEEDGARTGERTADRTATDPTDFAADEQALADAIA